MLPTAFAKASTSAKAAVDKSAVMMGKCCQFQYCQLSIGPRQARPPVAAVAQERDPPVRSGQRLHPSAA